MTEEWLLTVADVAEVLGISKDEVSSFIARNELTVTPGRRIRIAHSAVVEFVTTMQQDALTLGRELDFEPSIIASRPSPVVVHNNGSQR